MSARPLVVMRHPESHFDAPWVNRLLGKQRFAIQMNLTGVVCFLATADCWILCFGEGSAAVDAIESGYVEYGRYLFRLR